jgi:hypothetical protein
MSPSLQIAVYPLTDSLSVETSGVLVSFLDTFGASGSSVPLLALRSSTSGRVSSSSSVGSSSGSGSRYRSLRSGSGLSFGLSGSLGLGRRRRWLSVV